MKYVITCRYCNNGYAVDENGNQEFVCPTCGGANNIKNAVVMDDQEKIDAEVRRRVNTDVKKALEQRDYQEQLEEKIEKDLKWTSARMNLILRIGGALAIVIIAWLFFEFGI